MQSIHRRQALAASGSLFAGLALGEEPPEVDKAIQSAAGKAPLSLQFRGSTPAAAKQWQSQFSRVLRRQLGPHQPPREWRVAVESEKRLAKYRRRKLLLTAPGIPSLPIYVLIPHKMDGPRPGVLALHGHGTFGYDPVVRSGSDKQLVQAIQQANYDYGHQLAERGYVVVAPCMTPFGRRLHPEVANRSRKGSDPCAVTFVRLALLGRVLMAENLRDCLWAFEHLARMPSTDVKRLGCVGLSYGGRMTMLTAALEPRVSVAVVSGALNVMQERIQIRYSCGAQVIPGLLKYGDIPEIGGLIAPRACIWEVGDRDGLIKPAWARRAKKRINRVYSALGASNQIHYDHFSGGHRWNGKVAYPLMKKIWGI